MLEAICCTGAALRIGSSTYRRTPYDPQDYFELRDEEREEGGGKEEDGVKVAGRKDKVGSGSTSLLCTLTDM